jgi:hypothetical protein
MHVSWVHRERQSFTEQREREKRERGIYSQVLRRDGGRERRGDASVLAESMGSRLYSLVLITRCPNHDF